MGKHTAGKWVIRKGDEWTYVVVTEHGTLPNGEPNQWAVATINKSREEAAANLALIATAPDLLEALEALLGKAYKQNFNDAYPEVIDFVEGVISKARGQS